MPVYYGVFDAAVFDSIVFQVAGTVTPPIEQGPFYGTPSGGSQASAMTGGSGATGTTGGGATTGSAQGQLTNTASIGGGPSFKGS